MMVLDEAALARARSAQARLLDLQRDAERARVDYHDEIRRVHAAGGSLREIADALGLSHQRVHQIVDEAGGSELEGGALRQIATRVGGLRLGPFHRFSEPARGIVGEAVESVGDRGGNAVEAADLLLAALAADAPVAARTRAALDVDAAALHALRAPATAGSESTGKKLRFAPSAKATLAAALREAVALGHDHIGVEHVLLGAVAAPDERVDGALERLGTTRDALHTAVLQGRRRPV